MCAAHSAIERAERKSFVAFVAGMTADDPQKFSFFTRLTTRRAFAKPRID
jgi:hypothetical protein